MGNTVSQLSGPLTKEIVHQRTQNYTKLFSHIFDFMIKKLNITDVVSLQDSSRCKEYIVFMGDALMRFFNQFYIDIEQNKKGMIYFKKVSDLQRETEGTRRQYCEKIAFFYIRIFQIYSALALSVIDESFVIGESPVGQGGIPGARPTGVPFRGGSDPLKVQLIDELRKYSKIESNGKLKNTININITLLKDYITINNNFTYKFRYDISEYSSKKYKLSISHVLKKENNVYYNVRTQLGDFKMVQFNIDNIENELSTYFENNINKFEEKIKREERTLEKSKDRNPLQRRQEQDRYGYRTVEKAQGLQITNASSDALKTKKYYEIFASRIKIKPYCVSRALQLLRQDPGTNARPPVFTEICNTTFGESSMVPKKDGLISESLGLSSLAVLFYDIIENTTPKMSNKSVIEYIQFMKDMALIYNDRETRKENKNQGDLLKGIRSRSPANCKNVTKKAIVSDGNAIAGTKQYVNSMFKHQIEHAGKAALIIDKLFQIQKDGSIFLNKNAEAGGMRYLTLVADQAKQLLTEYYSKCEGLYALGSDLLASRGQLKAIEG